MVMCRLVGCASLVEIPKTIPICKDKPERASFWLSVQISAANSYSDHSASAE